MLGLSINRPGSVNRFGYWVKVKEKRPPEQVVKAK